MAPNSRDLQRQIFVEMVRSLPELTLSELSRLVRDRFSDLAAHVTVGDLLGRPAGPRPVGRPPGSGRGPGRPPSADKSGDGGGRKAAPGKGGPAKLKAARVDTRSQAGRDKYDDNVAKAVVSSSHPLSAQEIRAQVGGDELQARRALNRLIEAGRIAYKGQARGTRYLAP